jgi:hypothetical protein
VGQDQKSAHCTSLGGWASTAIAFKFVTYLVSTFPEQNKGTRIRQIEPFPLDKELIPCPQSTPGRVFQLFTSTNIPAHTRTHMHTLAQMGGDIRCSG